MFNGTRNDIGMAETIEGIVNMSSELDVLASSLSSDDVLGSLGNFNNPSITLNEHL